jgi:DNA-binding PadR family transcriptional regulator
MPKVPENVGLPALHILLALGEDTLHGYAIMQGIADRSRRRIRILPGTLYSTIRKMLEDGLIDEVPAPKGVDSEDARRRYYRVTRRGKVLAREEMARLSLLVELGKVFQP